MSHRWILLGVGLVVLVSLFPGRLEAASDTVTLTLPAGDPERGRAAFLKMNCTSCHRVAGEKGFPEPLSKTPGPTLGSYQAQKDPAELGMSIFAPSHEISATVRGKREGNKSPMPDFTNVMTVRQYIDLVAYIGSLDE